MTKLDTLVGTLHVSLLAALAVAGAAGTAAAQTAGFNLGPHVGWARAQDADDSNFLVGAHAEIRPIPWLGVQGAVDYRLATEYNFTTGDYLKVRSLPLTVTARIYPLATERLSLFAAVGGGWYHLLYDYSENLEDLGFDDDSDNTFGWHLGGGVVVPLTPSIAIFGEGRAVFVDPDQAVDDELANDIEEFDYDSTYIATGVNFQF